MIHIAILIYLPLLLIMVYVVRHRFLSLISSLSSLIILSLYEAGIRFKTNYIS